MTSKPASVTRRPQPASTLPVVKTPCQIHPTAIIADKARISGSYTVEIGENVVIHPYAELRAEACRIVIGRNTSISERAVVGLSGETETSNEDRAIVLGEGVNVETGAVVEAHSIDDGTTVDVKARVGRGAAVGKYCKIGPVEEVMAGEEIEDFTVVHSNGQRRVDTTLKEHAEMRDAKMAGQEKTVELMRRLIPNAASKWL